MKLLKIALLLAAAFSFSPALYAGEEAATGSGNEETLKAKTLKIDLEQAVGLAVLNNLDLKSLKYSTDIAMLDVVLAGSGLEPYLSASLSKSGDDSSRFLSLGPLSGEFESESGQDSMSVTLSKMWSPGTSLALTFSNMRDAYESFQNGTSVTKSASYSPTLSLSLSQPLLKGFGSKYNLSSVYYAKIGVEVSREERLAQLNSLAADVEGAYWGLVAARQMLQARQQSLLVAQELENMTRISVEVGRLPKVELTQAKLNVAIRRQELISARNDVKNAEDGLRMLIKPESTLEEWDVGIEPVQAPDLAQRPVDVTESIKKAISNRPEYKQVLLNLKMMEYARDIAYSDYLPSLNLVGSLSFSGLDSRSRSTDTTGDTFDPPDGDAAKFSDALDDMLEGNNRSWSVGLEFEMSLFRDPEYATYRKAKLEYEQAKIQKRQVESAFVLEIRTAARNLKTAYEQIEAARLSETLAQERLDAARKRLSLGLGTNLEFQQHQETLDLAKANRIAASVAYLSSVSAYEKAEGTIFQKYGKK